MSSRYWCSARPACSSAVTVSLVDVPVALVVVDTVLVTGTIANDEDKPLNAWEELRKSISDSRGLAAAAAEVAVS